jgi:membrane protein YqaA with SNARE-associated domain
VPIPPQVYMLASIAGGASPVGTITVVCVSSLLAGAVGYRLAGRLSELPFLRGRIAAARPRLDPLFARYGVWAVAIGTVTPMPYSVLCYLAGLYRLPPRLFGLLLLFRIPRIVFFYVLIRMMMQAS